MLRFEDLDMASVRAEHYRTQADDLRRLGLDWDGDMVRQSDRRALYDDAIGRLQRAGLTYRCYCSRREIQEATRAPNGPSVEGGYPGTCRALTDGDRAEREAQGRRSSLRVRGSDEPIEFVDLRCGPVAGVVDDVVIQRFDGTPAYNLAVIVDDVAQGIELVVRADDLLDSTPRQLHLARLLDLTPPAYAHVPLVLGPTGARLAKRDGAVTLADRLALGESPAEVLSFLAGSLGLAEEREPVSVETLRNRFDPTRLPTAALIVDPETLDLRRHRS